MEICKICIIFATKNVELVMKTVQTTETTEEKRELVPDVHTPLTAIKGKSMSAPARFLMDQGLIQGRALDFGCGYGFDTDQLRQRGFDIIGYDNYYRQDEPEGRFETIMCIYLLNVLDPLMQTRLLMRVSELLKPGGKAYFAVRRDLVGDKAFHGDFHYQCNVRLPFISLYSTDEYEIYLYQHYNYQPHHTTQRCSFCKLNKRTKMICETATCIAFYDSNPVSRGHALIVPKRHVENYFDLTPKEIQAMHIVLNRAKEIIDAKYHPDGYNIGVNVGESAGQSVFHVHMHLIPRYKGDVEEPKGGVRGVIPGKRDY